MTVVTMDVSIIIVNYNTTLLVQQCIASIYAHSRSVDFEIIVIDNASADRNIETIAQEFPQVQLLVNADNRGFGRANNQGIRLARGEFIFLLNSDTLLQSDALDVFVRFMRDPANSEVAVCGAELLSGTAKPATSFGNFPSLLNSVSSIGFSYLYRSYYRKHIAIGVANYDEEIKQVDWVSGADMFIRSTVLKETGIFDEDFFLYFEETELSYRITKAGYRSVLLPEVKIIHYEGSSTGLSDTNSNKGFNYAGFKQYVTSRNLFYKKAYGRFYAAVVKPFDILHTVIKSLTGKESGSLLPKLKILLRN